MKNFPTLYKGTIVHSLSQKKCIYYENSYLVVNDSGKIETIFHGNVEEIYPHSKVIDYGNNFIIPGFVDAHVHLPQYSYAGLGAGNLLEWLNNFTFPAEAKFSDPVLAYRGATIFFDDLVASGTTTASIFVTSHKEATNAAFSVAANKGIRAFIGKVIMERNGLESLLETPEISYNNCKELILKWHGHDNNRLQFVVTPRFPITCSEQSLAVCAKLAAEFDLFVQSHLSENNAEIEFTAELFPQANNYTDVYFKNNLLSNKTLLAHCLHVSSLEQSVLSENKTIAVHCPSSNRYLTSGVFPLRKLQQAGVKICLGSDVGGGYDLCMLHEMREAIESSKTYNLVFKEEPQELLSSEEALYLATLAGAEALQLDHCIGNFLPGKEADFIILNDSELNPFISLQMFQEPMQRLTRLIYRGGKENVEAVYVRGKNIHLNHKLSK